MNDVTTNKLQLPEPIKIIINDSNSEIKKLADQVKKANNDRLKDLERIKTLEEDLNSYHRYFEEVNLNLPSLNLTSMTINSKANMLNGTFSLTLFYFTKIL